MQGMPLERQGRPWGMMYCCTTPPSRCAVEAAIGCHTCCAAMRGRRDRRDISTSMKGGNDILATKNMLYTNNPIDSILAGSLSVAVKPAKVASSKPTNQPPCFFYFCTSASYYAVLADRPSWHDLLSTVCPTCIHMDFTVELLCVML